MVAHGHVEGVWKMMVANGHVEGVRKKINEKRKIKIVEIMLAYGHVEMEKKWI